MAGLAASEGAEKVSGVWLYAADNIRPGNVVGQGAAQILLPCAHPQHRCQPGKKSARAPASARGHRHMHEEVNDVLSGRGTVSSKIAALIGAKTMSGVFPFLAGISISIPRSPGAVSGASQPTVHGESRLYACGARGVEFPEVNTVSKELTQKVLSRWAELGLE